MDLMYIFISILIPLSSMIAFYRFFSNASLYQQLLSTHSMVFHFPFRIFLNVFRSGSFLFCFFSFSFSFSNSLRCVFCFRLAYLSLLQNITYFVVSSKTSEKIYFYCEITWNGNTSFSIYFFCIIRNRLDETTF